MGIDKESISIFERKNLEDQRLRENFLQSALRNYGKGFDELQTPEQFYVVGLALRDHLIPAAMKTYRRYREAGAKRAYYLSMEFLQGRLLGNNLINLGLMEESEGVLSQLGCDLQTMLAFEPDPGLANGGLGNVATNYIDSLCTQGYPGFGYGILYEYGLFRQAIVDGKQVELPDNWLAHRSPWLMPRPGEVVTISIGGHAGYETDGDGTYRAVWHPSYHIHGLPHDMPIVGWGGEHVHYLRLFQAKAGDDAFDIRIFNEGDYIQAVEKQVDVETVSRVLYPNDEPPEGQRLRLVQEYFLVACSVGDILRRISDEDLQRLPDLVAVHMNDTHPALAVLELMRILVDERGIPWDRAWDLTRGSCFYTNHTLLPEALERWPMPLFGEILPRHLQIVMAINHDFLEGVRRRWHADGARLARLSIVDEHGPKYLRMANLCVIGSTRVNGVAKIHSDLLTRRLFPEFAELDQDKFTNVTNGITPRRWLLNCNPSLGRFISEHLGDQDWVADLDRLRGLETLADDTAALQELMDMKRERKNVLADQLGQEHGFLIDTDSIFGVQIKRIHEYKRQLLFLMHVVHRYLRMKDGEPLAPRTFLLSGKAAPGYARAKQIIELAHAIAEVINHDPATSGGLRLYFVPNYSVRVAEALIPAADLSEQISTAGFEASGTGNMKFACNGALTVGTLDGANIEIREAVGHENFFLFGNTVDQLHDLEHHGTHPRYFYDTSSQIRRIVDAIRDGMFSGAGRVDRFRWVFDDLVDRWDRYFHLADLEGYIAAQEQADAAYADPHRWARMALLNISRMGYFSSDRTVRDYAAIWGLKAHPAEKSKR